MPERRLLLDTCALIWLVAGRQDLSDTAREAIDRADLVHVSAISAWEVSLKVARDQLNLPLPPRTWFDRALSRHNLASAPLTIDVLVSANELPWHHRDPADRNTRNGRAVKNEYRPCCQSNSALRKNTTPGSSHTRSNSSSGPHPDVTS